MAQASYHRLDNKHRGREYPGRLPLAAQRALPPLRSTHPAAVGRRPQELTRDGPGNHDLLESSAPVRGHEGAGQDENRQQSQQEESDLLKKRRERDGPTDDQTDRNRDQREDKSRNARERGPDESL